MLLQLNQSLARGLAQPVNVYIVVVLRAENFRPCHTLKARESLPDRIERFAIYLVPSIWIYHL